MTREENLHWLNQEIQTWENECQSKHPIKEALYAARKALEQESCEDAVSRQAVDGLAWQYLRKATDETIAFYEHFLDLPPVTPREPRKGHWIIDGHHRRCPECGEYFCINDAEGNKIPSSFCPNCGADMREVLKDEIN